MKKLERYGTRLRHDHLAPNLSLRERFSEPQRRPTRYCKIVSSISITRLRVMRGRWSRRRTVDRRSVLMNVMTPFVVHHLCWCLVWCP